MKLESKKNTSSNNEQKKLIRGKTEVLKQYDSSNETLAPRTQDKVTTIINIETALDKFLRAKLVEAKGDKAKMKKIVELLDKLPDQAVKIFNIAVKINKNYNNAAIKEAFYKWCDKNKIEYPKENQKKEHNKEQNK